MIYCHRACQTIKSHWSYCLSRLSSSHIRHVVTVDCIELKSWEVFAGYKNSIMLFLLVFLNIKFLNIFQKYTMYVNARCKIHTISSLINRLAVNHHQDTLSRQIYNPHRYSTFTTDHARCSIINCFFSLSSYATENTVYLDREDQLLVRDLKSTKVFT